MPIRALPRSLASGSLTAAAIKPYRFFFSLEENKQGHFRKNSVMFLFYVFSSAIELWNVLAHEQNILWKIFYPNISQAWITLARLLKGVVLFHFIFCLFVFKAILVDFNWYQHFRSSALKCLSLSGEMKIKF